MFARGGDVRLATIVFGLSTWFPLSLPALFVLGAADMVSVNIRSSLIQLSTPDTMRGRVSAVSMLFIGASNELGEFESGTTAALMGTVPAVVAGGIGTLLVVAGWMKLFPPLRRVTHSAMSPSVYGVLEIIGEMHGTAVRRGLRAIDKARRMIAGGEDLGEAEGDAGAGGDVIPVMLLGIDAATAEKIAAA